MTEKEIRSWDGESETPTVDNRKSLHKNIVYVKPEITKVTTSIRLTESAKNAIEELQKRWHTKTMSATIEKAVLNIIEIEKEKEKAKEEPLFITELKKQQDDAMLMDYVLNELSPAEKKKLYSELDRQFRQQAVIRKYVL